ncbi:MAG: aminotransferase class V-fold PLP-dependent enzyme [Ruminococcus sp.]|nr:aminotransferase class V-fold PLP-dependent enzyme [Ruminococcus sp.]
MRSYIYDFMKTYAESDVLRCHMPGHKGRGDKLPYSLDITEIKGADSLFEADGIILESEKNISSLYNTAASFYSASGSSLCIQAMLLAMKLEKRKIIAVRNVHRTFINAAALLSLDVKWILPYYRTGILSGEINYHEIEEMLSKNNNSCLYVTSPDYTGRMADIAGLSEICKKYNAPLLVDNAHGAHLNFFEKSLHPIALGADICCDSAHKMLPALTGAAILHTSQKRYAEILRQCMSIFASTSPSYLILASLDLCGSYIYENIRNDIAENLKYITDFRERFGGKLVFTDSEPFHITVNTSESFVNGNEFAILLRKNSVECEYADDNIVILLMSPMNKPDDYGRLSDAFENSLKAVERKYVPCKPFLKKLPEKALSIGEAAFALSTEVPVEMSEGRICASIKVPCPPAVPVTVSGEIIDSDCINIFQSYGIRTVLLTDESFKK